MSATRNASYMKLCMDTGQECVGFELRTTAYKYSTSTRMFIKFGLGDIFTKIYSSSAQLKDSPFN